MSMVIEWYIVAAICICLGSMIPRFAFSLFAIHWILWVALFAFVYYPGTGGLK